MATPKEVVSFQNVISKNKMKLLPGNKNKDKPSNTSLTRDDDFTGSPGIKNKEKRYSDRRSDLGRETPSKKSWKAQMPDLSKEDSILEEHLSKYEQFVEEKKANVEQSNRPPPSTSLLKRMWFKCGKSKKI